MNLTKLRLSTIVALSLVSIAPVQTASAQSSELTVTCANKVDQRVLSFDPEKNRWCDTTLTSFCKTKKLNAARNACTKRYASELKKLSNVAQEPEATKNSEVPEPVKVPVVANATDSDREKLVLELLDIEEKKLEIKRKQVELNKELLKLKQL